MSANSLKLNQDKFEYIVFHPRRQHFQPLDYSLTLADATFHPAEYVRNLGVVQDRCLTMERHINTVIRSCYNQLRSIGKIRKFITAEACKTLIQALVVSRLDYANALLHGVPQSQMARLQRLQNSAAPMISRTSYQAHITPVLIELHWLPVDYRPQFKVSLLTYKALHGLAPSYLKEMIKEYQPTRTLRSASKSLLEVPKARTAYGKKSFSHAAPVLWNNLPQHIKDAPSISSFKKRLKTHLFKTAYGL